MKLLKKKKKKTATSLNNSYPWKELPRTNWQLSYTDQKSRNSKAYRPQINKEEEGRKKKLK
jgi:hypothetical protein